MGIGWDRLEWVGMGRNMLESVKNELEWLELVGMGCDGLEWFRIGWDLGWVVLR